MMFGSEKGGENFFFKETKRDKRDVDFGAVYPFTRHRPKNTTSKDLERSKKWMAIQSSVQQEDDPTDERPTANVLLLFINMRSKFDEAPHSA